MIYQYTWVENAKRYHLFAKYIPLFELWVQHSAGEALTTDTDSLEYTVTLQLVKYQVGIKLN